jgi:hypothetical protein
MRLAFATKDAAPRSFVASVGARKRAALGCVAVAMGLFLTATPALAAQTSPWWAVTSSSRPTYLHAGSARNEVQQLVTAPGPSEEGEGTAFSLSVGGQPVGAFASEPLAAKFSLPLPTEANLQNALAGAYGAGNVAVTESLGAGGTSYLITTIGERANQGVAPVQATALIGSANATIATQGRSDGEIALSILNLGDAVAAGESSPVVITDTLPSNLDPVGIVAAKPVDGQLNVGTSEPVPCSLAALSCEMSKPLAPFDAIEVRIAVNLEPGAHSGELNRAAVTGGGAAPAEIARPISVIPGEAPFGVESYELRNEEEGGAPAIQAASHPFQQTTAITLNQGPDLLPLENESHRAEVEPTGLAKDLDFNWPPGLLGNPTSFPVCTSQQFNHTPPGLSLVNECPASTAVGVAVVTVQEPKTPLNLGTFTVPVFNLEPRLGEPARLGFIVEQSKAPVFIDPSVRFGSDYGLTPSTVNITQVAAFVSASVTIWGAPGDARHDDSRGWGCLAQTRRITGQGTCNPGGEAHPPAFLSQPTACSGPLVTSVNGDAWNSPLTSTALPELASFQMPALQGCNQVPFAPRISSEPTSNAATSPTGLSFDIDFHDEGQLNSQGLVESQIKKAVVTLPQGFTTNPSVAEGLHACSLGQYHSETLDSKSGTGCPENSKIGEVDIESPLVKQVIHGSLFIAKQGENPNENNLLTIYLVAKNPEIGVMITQALRVTPNPITGQLTTEVDNIPQLPFSHFHLAFREGQRAPLITPPTCGTYTVGADLYPWASPTEPVHRESSFTIDSGPEGLGCPSGGVPPFHPNLLAGSENPTAGAYSPFYTEISRKDSEQEITRFSIKLPPGVIGKLAGVSECSDAAIAAAKAREREGGGEEELQHPSCPANSEVGHSNVGSGVGNVLAYAPGKLYLAGPYHGSNLSLVSITAAKVGPFDLGTVVVRFALRINPETAEVFVDSQGSDPIPHIVDGIPVHLRDIQAFVDRQNFTLNPTSCAKKSTASTVLGSGLNFASEADDQPVTVTSPFQVGSCASLGFKPKLALSLKGGTKRAATPAFKAVVTYPKGTYANIARSVVALPHSEFLEQAHIKTVCTRVQFKAGGGNGEQCPKASIYGRAEAVTPLLSEPLKGPVYLRSSSHNLPDLVAALHNRQVDFDLDGRIDSFKGGIRNTFETVPDAPVSKFVLEMQGGKKGLLTNSTNLCKGKHYATSEFTGQNGKIYNTNPVVSVKCGGKGKKAKGGKKK